MAKKHPRIQRIERLETMISVLANVSGALLVIFYFENVQNGAVAPTFGDNLWAPALAAAAIVALLVLGNFIGGRALSPMWSWYQQAVEGKNPGPASEQVRRLALNVPFISTMVTMGMWVIAGLFFGVTSNMDLVGQRFDWAGFIWTMVGTMIAGGITVCLVYFAVERVWRSELPVFFPEGGLTEVRALRMTVRRRMLLLFILATTPMLLLGLLSYSLATRLAAAPDPVAWLSQLLRLELILVGGGLMIAIAMAILFSGTLIRPLETLSRRMVAVGQGDLTVRAQVESNDEIGVLSDSFNHTVENLQRRDQELQALYQISQGIASSIELQRTLATLLRNIQPIVPSDTAQVSLVEAGEQLFVRAQLRKNEEEVRYSEEGTSLEEGFGRWIREQRGGLLVADVGQLEAGSPLAAHLATGLPVGSYLGAPLRAGERLIGLIELASGQPSAFDEKNLRLLETIAPQAAGAIDNALQVLERERQLRRQIEQLTIEVDRARRDAQVAQITETEFFQNLQQEAQRIRERKKRASKSDKGPNDRE